MDSKKCSKCGHEKPLSEYGRRWRRKRHEYCPACKDCLSKSAKERFKNLTSEERIKHNRRKLEYYHKMKGTLSHVKARFTSYGIKDKSRAQEWIDIESCEICNREFTRDNRATKCIDHDHETGEYRGCLCGTCNMGIGLFKNDPELLEAAVAYLKSRKAAS